MNDTLSSPRFYAGMLCFYEGDTFEIEQNINLTDEDGSHVDIAASDTITIEYKNQDGVVIYFAEYSNIVDNAILINWDEEMTSHFVRGNYTYRMQYHGEFDRTIVANDIIVVQ